MQRKTNTSPSATWLPRGLQLMTLGKYNGSKVIMQISNELFHKGPKHETLPSLPHGAEVI